MFFRINVLSQLNILIKQQHLTEVLEALEFLDYSGDSAISLLTYLLQSQEVER